MQVRLTHFGTSSRANIGSLNSSKEFHSPQEPGTEQAVSFESFFRDPSLALDSPLAWSLAQKLTLMDAVRGLLVGPQAIAQLRLWCFLELCSQPQSRLSREDVNQLFHALTPEALELALRRLRELGLLEWDRGTQTYQLPPLAQQAQSLLAPLTRNSESGDDEMAALLSQVAGAQALGMTDPNQLRQLHAQLMRQYREFEEAITSGSETLLRKAQPRFERALALVNRANETLTALIRGSSDRAGDVVDARLEREARALGQAVSRLLSMASQFNRALQQADRSRITLGTTGVTSSDVRHWLQQHADALPDLIEGAHSSGVAPVFVSPHDLLDVTEAEFERDRPDPQRAQGLPAPMAAQAGEIEALKMPQELGDITHKFLSWSAGDAVAAHDVQEAVLGGRFAQAAYRLQLLPLLGDKEARELQGQTGDFARTNWRVALLPTLRVVPADEDAQVAAISEGKLYPEHMPHPYTDPDTTSA